MPEMLHVKVVTPKGSLVDEDVVSFTARSVLGEFCILPNHRAIMSALVVGPMIVERPKGGKTAYALDQGFLEAGEDHVNVITEQCLEADDLNRDELQKKVHSLEEELSSMDAESPEAAEIIKALKWATVQLHVLDHPNG